MFTFADLWYSTDKPTAVYEGNVYVWEETDYLQLGISVPYPVSVSPLHALLVLTSVEQGLPDAGLYTLVIRKIITAYLSNTLYISGSIVLNEAVPTPTPTAITGITNTPGINLIYSYTTDANNNAVCHIKVTDSYGFVMAFNEAVIVTNVDTTPGLVTDSLDVSYLPTSTADLANLGDFSAADATLLPSKALEIHWKYAPLPVYWYGSSLPTQFSTTQLAIIRNGTTSFSFYLVLPLDVVLTTATSPLVVGTVDVTNKCYGTKWWYPVLLDGSISDNHFQAFMGAIITAANNGVLFINTARISNLATGPVASSYHPVPNSITFTVSIRYKSGELTRSGATGFIQYVGITALNSTGNIEEISISGNSPVRVKCDSGLDAVFPDSEYVLTRCTRNTQCANTDITSTLAIHGTNVGINILQGRGGIPTGTELSTPERAVYWDITQRTALNVSTIRPTLLDFIILQVTPKVIYLPYLGRSSSIHSNHVARASVLGYSHYYYPDSFQPLDVGVIPEFGTYVTGANYAEWITSPTAIVSDDDTFFAIIEAKKGKCVFRNEPTYLVGSPTMQAATKHISLYLKDRETLFTTVTAYSDTALTLDSSRLRAPTPVLSTNYSNPIVEHQCIATYNLDTLTFKSLSNVICAGTLYIGFSGQSTVPAYQINHSLTLPDPVGSTVAITGVTNYPEYAVPYTLTSPISNVDDVNAPLAPKFVGRLPPNYRMIWVDWTSINGSTITVYWWKGDDAYDPTTVYTTPAPGSAIQTLSVTLIPGTESLIALDGSVQLSIELRQVNDTAALRLYAGDTMVADYTGAGLPWIHAGSIYCHARGAMDVLDDVIFGNIGIQVGVHKSPLDGAASTDYIELRAEIINVPISATTLTQHTLRPYTVYWDTSERALYIPVMDSLTPTRLAKSQFFSAAPSTPTIIAALMDNNVPGERIYLSNNHGLDYIPSNVDYNLFTTKPIGSESTIIFYWRKDANYSTIIGPIAATIVPGVTVPPTDKVPSNGSTSNLDDGTWSGYTSIGNSILLNGDPAYVKYPLRMEDPNTVMYTTQFTRTSEGVFQTGEVSTSHLGVYLYPNKPSSTGIPDYPLLPSPQHKAVRVMIGKTGVIQVQTSNYRGYSWDPVNTSTGPMDVTTPCALSGSATLGNNEGGSIIGVTFSNQAGMLGIKVTENQTIKLLGVLPIPYINNGTLAIVLQGAAQATETLGDLNIHMGEVIPPHTASDSLVYCVPTTTLSTSTTLLANVTTAIVSIPSQAKYGYMDYTLSNNGLQPVTVSLYTATEMPTDGVFPIRNLMARYYLLVGATVSKDLVFLNRHDTVYMVADMPNVDVSSNTIVQL